MKIVPRVPVRVQVVKPRTGTGTGSEKCSTCRALIGTKFNFVSPFRVSFFSQGILNSGQQNSETISPTFGFREKRNESIGLSLREFDTVSKLMDL